MQDNECQLRYIPIKDQLADYLTKAMPNPKWKTFILGIGLYLGQKGKTRVFEGQYQTNLQWVQLSLYHPTICLNQLRNGFPGRSKHLLNDKEHYNTKRCRTTLLSVDKTITPFGAEPSILRRNHVTSHMTWFLAGQTFNKLLNQVDIPLDHSTCDKFGGKTFFKNYILPKKGPYR